MAVVAARTTRSMARAERTAAEREAADLRAPASAAAAAAAAKEMEGLHAPPPQMPVADKKRRRGLAYSSSGLAPTRQQSQKQRIGSDTGADHLEASEKQIEDFQMIVENLEDQQIFDNDYQQGREGAGGAAVGEDCAAVGEDCAAVGEDCAAEGEEVTEDKEVAPSEITTAGAGDGEVSEKQNEDLQMIAGNVEDNPDSHCQQACEDAGDAAEGEDCTVADEEKEEDEDVLPSPQVQKEIRLFNEQFPWLQSNYRLLDKIGEGTFSTVYKAVDLRHHEYDNSRWEKCLAGLGTQDNSGQYVAIKRVYVTSSPERIANEISILRDLTGHESVVPLITAFRHEDQVIIVLPYFPHQDFRDYFATFDADDTRAFMRCLLGALAHAHSHKIIHRDVKPSNFLYDPRLRKGSLVDFGLAEREDPEPVTGTRLSEQKPGKSRLCCSVSNPGIWKGDARPSIRASRAGTRGFRAPEVLFKVIRQTVAIDVWAAGVILLCIITRRFPFFSSPDDVEALGELTAVFGNVEMAKVAEKLNRTFHTNIPTMRFERSKLEKYARWFHVKDGNVLPDSAFDLLNKLMALDPVERITAADALRHPFLAE